VILEVVNPKNRVWLLITTLAVLCAASVGGVAWYRSRPISTGMLLKRIPAQNAVVLYVDFAALRRGNILKLLESSRATEEPDYQSFARKTDFDYRQDLDAAIVAFTPSGKYLLVRGRFNWKSLRSYATDEGGSCANSICKMTGSTPERRISFFPVQSGLMAMAVSKDDSAVSALIPSPSGPPMDAPNAPVWLSVPGAFFQSGENLPSGTRMFARGMEKAERVILTLAPEDNRLATRLEVRCRSAADASDVASQLNIATLTLKQMLDREHQKPGPGDLAGVLAAGTFRSEGQSVFGYWPMERAFVESILGGVN
jgi:hypothetical protein